MRADSRNDTTRSDNLLELYFTVLVTFTKIVSMSLVTYSFVWQLWSDSTHLRDAQVLPIT
ncbi:hypothetical protein BDV30DRAFT_213839 [Aspergillus minisclerotigenes]|uniref:Uncharacterized protein n=1 Tax=Aspergillus minisclerotigenes TaxID=656917 RepID=A0A5N6IXC6_9EURO|nr:hypothetical protein BDV30DRAFT_213839 [Aspergillus minisclerotigenes]